MWPHPDWILQEYTISEVSDTHSSTVLKSLNNIGILSHMKSPIKEKKRKGKRKRFLLMRSVFFPKWLIYLSIDNYQMQIIRG